MNKELVKAWIEALRSKKYSQTSGILRSDKGLLHCVLGVGIDILPYNGKVWEQYEKKEGFFATNELLPDYLSSEFFKGTKKSLMENEDYQEFLCLNGKSSSEEKTITVFLAYLNDAGKTFDEIADVIETYILGADCDG